MTTMRIVLVLDGKKVANELSGSYAKIEVHRQTMTAGILLKQKQKNVILSKSFD